MNRCRLGIGLMAFYLMLTSGGGGSGTDVSSSSRSLDGSSTGGERNPVCSAGQSDREVQPPGFVRNLAGQTSWFALPVVADLDNDGEKELIAAYYSLYALSPSGDLIDRVDGNGSRIYAPHVVVDLEGDGTVDIVCGQGRHVYTYEWVNRQFSLKAGWPKDTTSAGSSPEVRGLAAADLDGNGSIEIIATTTQTLATDEGGAQVYVWSPNGELYQPAGLAYAAWPRYNHRTGEGGDADRNGMGHSGFGCYGLNVGVGDIDDDLQREIIVTYDNHHIQVFDPDGQAIDAAPWFTNRSADYLGNRMTWGQIIRWCEPDVEADHYHLHEGEWPHPEWDEWLQWTASPPHVADLDLDGRNEVIGIPNVEFDVPYVTQAYAIMVLEGAHGDGNGAPAAPSLADLDGDGQLEIMVQTFDHGMDIFSVPGSGCDCLLWTTARGGPLRMGQPSAMDCQALSPRPKWVAAKGPMSLFSLHLK